MDWTMKMVLDFLDYYEKEPIIWNLNANRNRDEVCDAWKRIEEKMDKKFSITELKKKKESLMASYRGYLSKMRGSIKHGEKVYEPQWFAFNKMDSFLKYKDRLPEAINPQDFFSQEGYENDEEEQECNQEAQNAARFSPEDEEPKQTDLENDGIVLPENAFRISSPKKRKMDDSNDLKDKLNNAYSILESTAKKFAKRRTVCDIYGELVAAKLRSMDEYSREICMHRIDILFEMKMKFNVPTNYHSPLPNHQLISHSENSTIQVPVSSQQDCRSSSHQIPSGFSEALLPLQIILNESEPNSSDNSNIKWKETNEDFI